MTYSEARQAFSEILSKHAVITLSRTLHPHRVFP